VAVALVLKPAERRNGVKRQGTCLSLVVAFLAVGSGGLSQDGASKVNLEGDEARRIKLAAIQGKPAPDLEIKEWFNGKPLKLKELKGKVVMLDFWGTW
jgi:hypothetical protein